MPATPLARRGLENDRAPSEQVRLRHPVEGGVALERAHVARKQSEANGASAISVVDAVDQWRQFLAPVAVGVKQVRLVVIGGNQVEQHHADAERLVARHAVPGLLEAAKQESGVARLVKIGFVPEAAEIADP